MKCFLLCSFLLVPALGLAEKPQVDPADFPVQVRVLRSEIFSLSGQSRDFSQLDVMIGQDHLTLRAEDSGFFLMPLQTYSAKGPTKIKHAERSPSYVLQNCYILLMPDGHTRTFDVVGMEATAPNP